MIEVGPIEKPGALYVLDLQRMDDLVASIGRIFAERRLTDPIKAFLRQFLTKIGK
jgi:hypothetical protein